MDTHKTNPNLFNEFAPISNQQWKDKIQQDLKGADFNKKLVWKTLEGFEQMPYYRKSDLEKLNKSGNIDIQNKQYQQYKTNNNDWLIRQDIHVLSEKQANQKALRILQKGVSSLHFIINSEIQIEQLLQDIIPEAVELNFTLNTTLSQIETITNFLATNNSNKIQGSFSFDPIIDFAFGKITETELKIQLDTLAQILPKLQKQLPNFKLIQLSANQIANTGTHSVQQLSYTLSLANEYFQQFIQRGLSIPQIAKALKLNTAISSNYFMELAKLRSIKTLWAALLEAYDFTQTKAENLRIHAETSNWNKTIYDPYVNMLRTTTEAMSASLGGIDSLTVLPFDSNYTESNEFSERIARNQQIILKEESFFDQVIVPAAGSYYIEELTHNLITNSWDKFKKLESQNSFINLIKSETIQTQIEATQAEREKNIATRKEILLGTNQYPNPANKTPETNIDSTPIQNQNSFNPLQTKRAASQIETIRKQIETSQKIPKIFLFTYGNPVFRKARAAFAQNFFACGGFEIIDNIGFQSIDEGIEAFKKSNSQILIACGADNEYADWIPELKSKISKETNFAIAGYPKALFEQFATIGIDKYIHLKSNLVKELKNYQNKTK